MNNSCLIHGNSCSGCKGLTPISSARSDGNLAGHASRRDSNGGQADSAASAYILYFVLNVINI